MANRRAHSIVGAAFGGTTAFVLARDQDPGHRLMESLGGALGGAWGGRLPDLIEPALHPGHRSVAHALAPAGIAGAAVVPRLRAGQQHVRERAGRCRARRDTATNALKQFLWWLAEVACRIAAGAMAGVAAGYASYLLLDAGTPRGLPLLA